MTGRGEDYISNSWNLLSSSNKRWNYYGTLGGEAYAGLSRSNLNARVTLWRKEGRNEADRRAEV